MKKIFIASDHAGFKLKESIKLYLDKKKIAYRDLGPSNDDRVDYPDFAKKLSKRLLQIKEALVFLYVAQVWGWQSQRIRQKI